MAWTAPRTWVTGELVTAAMGNQQWRDNELFLYGVRTDERAYSESATSVTTSNTTEATAATLVGPTAAFTPDGTEKVWIEFWAPGYNTNQTAQEAYVTLFEDSTAIGRARLALINSTFMSENVHVARRRQPSNASHTYTAKVHTAGGSITVLAGAGGSATDLPMFLRVNRVGA